MSEESDALLHIADDHPCCKLTLLWVHNRLLELERESAALKQRIIDDNKAYGCEIRDPSGTIWDHAQKLQKKNAALRDDKARLDSIKHGWRFSCEEGSVGYPDNWFIWTEDWSKPLGSGPDIRAAIDAARKEAQP